MSALPRLHQLRVEDAIIDNGFLGYLAQYDDTIFDGTEIEDQILIFQDVLTDIEIAFKKLGISMNPVKDYNDERRS